MPWEKSKQFLGQFAAAIPPVYRNVLIDQPKD